MENDLPKENFFFRFIIDLGKQIDEIETPSLQGFMRQIVTVIGVTIFFSSFFYTISFFWIKLLVYFYNI